MIRICMVGTGYVGLVSGACMADFGHQRHLRRHQRRTHRATWRRARSPSTSRDWTAWSSRTSQEERLLLHHRPGRRACSEADVVLHRRADTHVRIRRSRPAVRDEGGRGDRRAAGRLQGDRHQEHGAGGHQPRLRQGHQGQPEAGRAPSTWPATPSSCARARASTTSCARTAWSSASRPSVPRSCCARSTGRCTCWTPPSSTTGIETAELIKYAANSFLAVKISFINEIATLAEQRRRRRLRRRQGHGPGQAHRPEVPARRAWASAAAACPRTPTPSCHIAEEAGADMSIVRAAIGVNAGLPGPRHGQGRSGWPATSRAGPWPCWAWPSSPTPTTSARRPACEIVRLLQERGCQRARARPGRHGQFPRCSTPTWPTAERPTRPAQGADLVHPGHRVEPVPAAGFRAPGATMAGQALPGLPQRVRSRPSRAVRLPLRLLRPGRADLRPRPEPVPLQRPAGRVRPVERRP